jgi:hypothetical protein
MHLEVDMGRRGHSTTIGKFAKIHHDRRLSEIRRLGVALRGEQGAGGHADGPKLETSVPVPQAD